MKNENNHDVIGSEPILSLALHFDDYDEHIKPSLIPDTADQEKVERSPLSPEEAQELEQCENDIEDAISGFYTVGLRLRMIKLKKLYRAAYDTFDEYCQKRFGFGQNYANRIARASKVVENLKSVPNGTVSVPTTEAQARALCSLPPEQQIEAARNLQKKTGDKEPTTKDYQEEVNKMVKPTAKKAKKGAAKGTGNKASEPNKASEQTTFCFYDNAQAQSTPKVVSLAVVDNERKLMPWAEVHKLVIQLHNDYLNSLDQRVREGFKVLKAETKKLAEAELVKLQEAA